MNDETTYRIRFKLEQGTWVQYGGSNYCPPAEGIVPAVENILTMDHKAHITIWPKEDDDEPPW